MCWRQGVGIGRRGYVSWPVVFSSLLAEKRWHADLWFLFFNRELQHGACLKCPSIEASIEFEIVYG